MKILAIGLLLTCSLSAAAADCDLRKTILPPLTNNSCFEKLLTKVKDAEDKKWLLSLQRKWNRPTGYAVTSVPGGLILSNGGKTVLDARLLYVNPLVLSWNGKIFIHKGKLKTNSIRRMVDEILDDPTKSAAYSLIPSAFAVDDSMARDFYSLYYIGNGDVVDAATFIAQHKNIRNVFPVLNAYEKYWSGRSLKCTKEGGLESVTFDFNEEGKVRNWMAGAPQQRLVTVRATSPTVVEVSGLFGPEGKTTMHVEYGPDQSMSDEKAKVFRAQTFLCGGQGHKFSKCENADCSKKTELGNLKMEELEALARPFHKYDTGCSLNNAMTGVSILANCCKQSSCREAAEDNLKISLKPVQEDPETTR